MTGGGCSTPDCGPALRSGAGAAGAQERAGGRALWSGGGIPDWLPAVKLFRLVATKPTAYGVLPSAVLSSNSVSTSGRPS